MLKYVDWAPSALKLDLIGIGGTIPVLIKRPIIRAKAEMVRNEQI